ncbi:MAG: hypothetical protein KBD06_00110 [Candidatus Pacebacteria bacterium]|nr:hypothetical protein [Candidatus Paceibacterota bacterium]
MLDTFKKATPDALAAIAEEMKVRRTKEVFLLFAMGSQTDHLIYQQIAKLGVFCLVADPATVRVADVAALKPTGIIGSGGPGSVDTEPPPFDDAIFAWCLDNRVPYLGICLSFQMWAKWIGLQVKTGDHQFGVHDMVRERSALFVGCPRNMTVLQSHGDEISEIAKIRSDGFRPTGECHRVMAAGEFQRILYGVQFHPEVSETIHGPNIFSNFVFRICKAKNRYPVKSVAHRKIREIRQTVGDGTVLLALSGGSDSSVCAYLLKKAKLGKGKVHAVYIRGIDRPDDEEFVLKYFRDQEWLTLEIVDATTEFLEAFKGIEDMRGKRIAMRSVYKPILEAIAKRIGATHICQGTLYTDISESGGGHDSGARKSVIKLHHNTNLGFYLPELLPLVDCVKDSARDIGREISVPEVLLSRHPFPGPGQAVRNEGEITEKKLAMSRKADGIWIEELRRAGYYEKVWQAGAVVTKSEHTSTKGDEGGSGLVIALWSVWSVNGFTAQAAELPWWLIKRASRRIGNEVKGCGAVVYRTSDKPFSTIEWG